MQKLNEAHQAAEESERIRKTLENKTNLEDDRISFLENELAQARQIAEESDKKYEDVSYASLLELLRQSQLSDQDLPSPANTD